MAILEFLRRQTAPQNTGGSPSDNNEHTATTQHPTEVVQSAATMTTTQSQLGATLLSGAATTATASTALITSPTATSTSSSTTTTAAASHSGGESITTKLAIALPIAIVGALAITAIVFFLIRRRRRKQRGAVPTSPTYDTDEREIISTTQILSGPPMSQIMDVPAIRDSEVSAGQMAAHESHSEMGYGVTVSRDQRPNATEQTSPANAVGSQIRLPSENHGAADDDLVSVVSDEHRAHGHDYDDMSSVSSFDGSSPRPNDHQHPFR
ncbi:uncharacterized protein N7503_012115 [Penicillium pulvis]|uniref:uncharacterized protein n=1 Tax=Penicillium pulvis TaxID=1562058 RepID=UPI00254872FA|nr:uncharacterized protein N7503_012115 [Penicillium pulvis]KAJ5786903.1 hypothetical protein N7503_012115 [Penicillium pulvis]